MFEIQGKVTTAICYAKVIGNNAVEQIRTIVCEDMVAGAICENCYYRIQKRGCMIELSNGPEGTD